MCVCVCVHSVLDPFACSSRFSFVFWKCPFRISSRTLTILTAGIVLKTVHKTCLPCPFQFTFRLSRYISRCSARDTPYVSEWTVKLRKFLRPEIFIARNHVYVPVWCTRSWLFCSNLHTEIKFDYTLNVWSSWRYKWNVRYSFYIPLSYNNLLRLGLKRPK